MRLPGLFLTLLAALMFPPVSVRAEDVSSRPQRGRTDALHAAVVRGDRALVQRLLEAGADVDRANRAGETPLEVAARRGHIGLVRELLSLGARAPSAPERTAIRVVLPVSSGAGVRLAEEWGWHGRELVFRRLHVRLLTSAAETVPVPLEVGSPLDEALMDGELALAVDGPDGQPVQAEVAQQTESVMQLSDEGPHIELTGWKTGRSAWKVAPALAPGRWQLIGLDALQAPFPAFTPGELEAAFELGAPLSPENRPRWLAVLRRSPESARPFIHRMHLRLRLASGAVKTLELQLPSGC